jgi:hypothetical protein
VAHILSDSKRKSGKTVNGNEDLMARMGQKGQAQKSRNREQTKPNSTQIEKYIFKVHRKQYECKVESQSAHTWT